MARRCFGKCVQYIYHGRTSGAYEYAGKCNVCCVFIKRECIINYKCPCCKQICRTHSRFRKTMKKKIEEAFRY